MNITEVLDSTLKKSFPGIFYFTVGILISALVIMKPIFVVVQIHENVVLREVHQTVGWLSMKTIISRDTMA